MMLLSIIVATCLHIVAAIFWAGSTMAFACTNTLPDKRFFGLQMLAGAITVVAGTYLWHHLHAGSFQVYEQSLAVAAVSAIFAFVIQLIAGARALFHRGMPSGNAVTTARILSVTYRTSAALLLIAAIGMASAKYASAYIEMLTSP